MLWRHVVRYVISPSQPRHSLSVLSKVSWNCGPVSAMVVLVTLWPLPICCFWFYPLNLVPGLIWPATGLHPIGLLLVILCTADFSVDYFLPEVAAHQEATMLTICRHISLGRKWLRHLRRFDVDIIKLPPPYSWKTQWSDLRSATRPVLPECNMKASAWSALVLEQPST